MFGRSSEKIDPSQKDMFEEDAPSIEEVVSEEQITVPAHRRTKAGREPLGPSIPREDIIHDIPEEEKLCGCGHRLAKVDEVISERLKHIPEQIYVERHICLKYACKNCEGSGGSLHPARQHRHLGPSCLYPCE